LQFKTSDNLIDLLVGQSLYSSPDVALRELLQNAEDACQLQSFINQSYEPEIVVRFSMAEGWIEIVDNGLGMDQDVFQESFATIGASKTSSPKLKELLSKVDTSIRPIGQFGIGVLSCFGIANIVEVRSCSEGETPVSVRIRGLREPFEELIDHRTSRGTTLRLSLIPGGPMQAQQVKDALVRYVRHARHILIENIDSKERSVLPEQWLLDNWESSSAVCINSIESGFLQLSEAWDNINHGLDDQLVLCNAGFHVLTTGAGSLAEFATGIRGEINVRPGALTILMNREGFQHDAKWSTLVNDLKAHYQNLVTEKLETWLNADFTNMKVERLRAIQRMVLLIIKSPLGQTVGDRNIEKAKKLLPHVLLIGDEYVKSFDSLIETARSTPPLYVFRTDDQQQVHRSFSDRGQNFSLTETVGSISLRISLLKLNGFAVTHAERHDYVLQFVNGNRSFHIHDFDVLVEACNSLGIEVKRVQDAPTEHTRIGTSPDAQAITNLFEMSSEIKIQQVENMTNAIIADFNGYILNLDNAEIRSILNIMPDAVGNPVHKNLLSAYLALSTYNVSFARDIILGLITDPEFESKARRTTGRFFKAYLEERVKALLHSMETDDA
jgi:hypothetical protein